MHGHTLRVQQQKKRWRGGSLQHGNKHMNNDIGVLQNKNTPPPRHTNKTTHTLTYFQRNEKRWQSED